MSDPNPQSDQPQPLQEHDALQQPLLMHEQGEGRDAALGDLLAAAEAGGGPSVGGADEPLLGPHKAPGVLQDMADQALLAWPLALNLIAAYATSIINYSFVGHLGKRELAGAALGNSFVGITARYVLQGLCGALDTQAAQAYGAGNYDALGPIFKRTLLFLWAHCLPISGLLLGAPALLRLLSKDEQLAAMAHRYIVALLPAVWLDAVARPLNRILVAQRITKPQMVVSLAVVPLHLATTYALVFPLRFGYLGAALAMGAANGYGVLLTLAYVYCAGLAPRVLGGSWARVFSLQSWGTMVKLA